MKKFMKGVVSDETDRYSSKRVAAFVALFYGLTMYAIRGERMDFDIFVSLLVFVAGALGISGVEKIAVRKK